jgi:hypothetical protein
MMNDLARAMRRWKKIKRGLMVRLKESFKGGFKGGLKVW